MENKLTSHNKNLISTTANFHFWNKIFGCLQQVWNDSVPELQVHNKNYKLCWSTSRSRVQAQSYRVDKKKERF